MSAVARSAQEIAKGDLVMLMLAAANNDDREFEDPLTLDVDRENSRQLVFGGGAHRCLGSHPARQELSIALEEIFATLGPFRVPRARMSISFQASAQPTARRWNGRRRSPSELGTQALRRRSNRDTIAVRTVRPSPGPRMAKARFGFPFSFASRRYQ
jgi:hypothetical protein